MSSAADDRQRRISVVIPLYNGAPYIREALESVLTQTRPPDEIIVVDDGSTDDGAAIVRAFAADPPIRLISKPNGGQSSARNRGVECASGELIALLDQDDTWYPDHLAALEAPFRGPHRRPLGWSYGNLDEVDERGRMVRHACLGALPFHHPKTDLFECLRHDMFVLPSCSLVARAAFEAAGYFDEQLSGYEDDDFFLRVFRAGFDNVFIDLPLTRWRIHSGSSSYSYRMADSRMVYLQKLLGEFPDDPRRDRVISRDCLARRFLPLMVRDYRIALKSGCRRQLGQAVDELWFVARLRWPRTRQGLALLMPALRSPLLARPTLAAATGLRRLARMMRR